MRNLSNTPQQIIVSIIEALNTNTRSFALGMDQPYSKIYDICRGKTRIISNNVIKSITETYHVRRTYLATGEGEMFESSDVSETSTDSDDQVTCRLLQAITALNNELTTHKRRVRELEAMLSRAIRLHPDIAQLLSECIINETDEAENQ